jgi:hypothetical protein
MEWSTVVDHGPRALMKASSDILRRSLIVGSTISLLVAIASCIGLAAPFIKPTLDLHELYRISSLTRTAGFCFLGSYLVAGFAFPNEAAASVKTSSLEPRVLKIIFVVCFLVIVFSPHTYVYPEAIGWVTKSKAGTFSVSSDVAREYLWRAVRMWSAIPLCLSLSVIAFARGFSLQAGLPLFR